MDDTEYYSLVRKSTDGATTVWEFSFADGYLDRDYIHAVVIDTATGKSSPVDFEWVGPNQIKIEPALPAGNVLEIYRDTYKVMPLVDYTDGSILNERNLNRNAKQAIHAVAELVDRFKDTDMLAAESALIAKEAADRAEEAKDIAVDAAERAEDAAHNSDANALRQDLADPTKGDALVAVQAPGGTVRTQHEKNLDIFSVRDYITTVVDGVVSNQAGIQAAVNAAIAAGAMLYWPAGLYVSTDNIQGFWSVQHVGRGRIKRGDNIWHITPFGTQENVLCVAAGYVVGNDGLSMSEPLSPQAAFDNLGLIGSKSANGQWTIRMSGAMSYRGVRLTTPLPIFARRLQVLGDDVPGLNDVPTTVWDGTNSTPVYAVRIERDTAPSLFILMRNIKFTNWDKGTNSGAVVIWDAGSVRLENLHVDGAGVGLWVNRCDVVVERGILENCSTRGASFEYHAKFNIGRVDRDYGVTIRNCGTGVQIGRNSVGYVQGCVLEYNRVNIGPSRLSRWRSRNNLHREWEVAAYSSAIATAFTPDNGAGQPDIFEHSDPNAQVYVAAMGSIHMHIERGGHRTVHLVSDGTIIDIANQAGQSVLLSAGGRDSFVPFRMPAFAMKNTSIRLDVEILVNIEGNSSGVLALNGAGPGTTVRLAACTFPTVSGSRVYKVTFTVFRQPGQSSIRYRAALESADGVSFQSGSVSNPNHTAISEHSEVQKLFRLYWEPTTNNNARFYAMRTYVEY